MSVETLTIQICTASVSLVASAVIIVMILVSPNKLTSPYRRLIFGMSMADVLQSLALVTGPFAIPVGTINAPFGTGNVHTCELNGFFMVFGSTTVPLYMFALSLFYRLKLDLKMTNGEFTKKIEKWIHILIIMSMLTICFFGVGFSSFNQSPSGAFCFLEEYPFRCKGTEGVECIRGLKGTSQLLCITLIILVLCLLGITINMSMLCIKSCHIEKMYRSRAGDPEDRLGSKRSCCLQDFLCCVHCRNYDQFMHEGDADYVLRLYKAETIIQSSLYVGAFFLSYMCPLMQTFGSFFGYKFPPFFGYVMSFLYPLGGLFNIFVYTRPKVVRFRHAYPEISRLRSLLLVIKAGGEVPELAVNPYDLSFCCHRNDHTVIASNCDDQNRNQTIDTPVSARLVQSRMLGSLLD
jgi:hypothetical protein